MLTLGQKAHFETFGFLIIRQVFEIDEVSIIQQEVDDLFAEERDGRSAGDETQFVQPFFERKPFLSTLVDDDRIYNIGLNLLGPDFILGQTEGRSRPGDTPWHGMEVYKLGTVKINLYTDILTKDNGALRFVPGSHKYSDPDIYDQLRQQNDDPGFRPFGMRPSEIPCYAAETRPGDLVIFTEDTLHSSFGGALGRQQLAINFWKSPKTAGDEAHIKNLYKRFKYGLRPAESYVHSERPRIRHMVSKLVELGFETSKI